MAYLTVAVTPSIRLSFFSTRAAHEASVIPPMTKLGLVGRGARGMAGHQSLPPRPSPTDASGREVVVARLVEGGRDGLTVQGSGASDHDG